MEANKVYYGRCANGEFFSSQHRNLKSKLSTGWRISDQEYCLRIQNEGKIPQSHIYPKASFVLGSFRVSSHSAYFCPLSRRYRISCFPVFMLVRFYVNSNKKPNTSISFTVAFSNIFHDNFVVFIFGSLWIYFLEPSSESFTKEETIQMYTNEFGFWYNVICKQFK